MTKSGQAWTGARLPVSARFASALVPASLDAGKLRYGGVMRAERSEISGRCGVSASRLRDLRNEQKVQDESWQLVATAMGGATYATAPAHESIPAQPGGAGPYPWRRPV